MTIQNRRKLSSGQQQKILAVASIPGQWPAYLGRCQHTWAGASIPGQVSASLGRCQHPWAGASIPGCQHPWEVASIAGEWPAYLGSGQQLLSTGRDLQGQAEDWRWTRPCASLLGSHQRLLSRSRIHLWQPWSDR